MRGDLGALSVMPEVYGQECQAWEPRRVFGRLRDQLPEHYADRRLTAEQAAVLVKRSASHLRNLARKGRVSHGHEGREYRFSLADLANYCASLWGARGQPWTPEEDDELRRGLWPEGRGVKARCERRRRLGLPMAPRGAGIRWSADEERALRETGRAPGRSANACRIKRSRLGPRMCQTHVNRKAT